MSKKAIDEILSRWYRDKQFREQLRNNPQRALANYDLTQKQKAKLFKLKRETGVGKQETAVSQAAQSNHPFSLN